MKFRVTFKDPDGVEESILDAVGTIKGGTPFVVMEFPNGADLDQILRQTIKPWVWCSEYVTIEFDTDDGTATVVPQEDV